MRDAEQEKFRKSIQINVNNGTIAYEPSAVAREILEDNALELAKFLKGTPNEKLIAYGDPKVKELVNYVITALLLECQNASFPGFSFPLELYMRYKSIDSLKTKIAKYGIVTDYLGFKIIPKAEHEILFSNGDNTLQNMINFREYIRDFIMRSHRFLMEHEYSTSLTFRSYSEKCIEVLDKLQEMFPIENATDRISYYEKRKEDILKDMQAYNDTYGSLEEEKPLDEIRRQSRFDIYELLQELSSKMQSEIVLYVLRNNIVNTINNSALLHNLGISISSSKDRTKFMCCRNGYMSEFIGLDLSIPMESGEVIVLPIECQIQTIEQFDERKFWIFCT